MPACRKLAVLIRLNLQEEHPCKVHIRQESQMAGYSKCRERQQTPDARDATSQQQNFICFFGFFFSFSFGFFFCRGLGVAGAGSWWPDITLKEIYKAKFSSRKQCQKYIECVKEIRNVQPDFTRDVRKNFPYCAIQISSCL